MPPITTPTPTTGRLAPSPTGGLHLGHARTFLLAWLSARAGGGRVIFRLEDLDASRARPDAALAAIDDLCWLGIDWDEGPDIGGPSSPYVQSLRMDRYEHSLERLREQDAIYPCTCTRADIARAASAPHPEDEGPVYPGTCSGRSARDAASLGDRPFAWRFRVPPGPVAWRDGFRGEVSLDPARLGGDFVVARSGVGPSYQLAVVHDDAAMGVTEVIRGDDLMPSTPRQLLLYRSLGLEPPTFAHVPLAIGPDGRRLAKRDGSLKLSTLRASGWDPHHLVGWLARACGMTDRIEPGPPASWIDRFDLGRVPRQPWVVDLSPMSRPPGS
ncbi:tRNA glutamyl-Q(34) synthetase GluQRS [Tundrisphaera sp. TA3]|uniref:tRNA glutamyl-Q(34) synthetase GluQRS n=1 Tax=Tundrisphaera sp. TA3 TaxID=3435775 RepID=UPI003EB7F493